MKPNILLRVKFIKSKRVSIVNSRYFVSSIINITIIRFFDICNLWNDLNNQLYLSMFDINHLLKNWANIIANVVTSWCICQEIICHNIFSDIDRNISSIIMISGKGLVEHSQVCEWGVACVTPGKRKHF